MQLCLASSAESGASLQDQIRAAAEAGIRCLDLSLPALDHYLASYPTVVLVSLLQECGLYVGMISGLPPLPLAEGAGLTHAQRRSVLTHEPFLLFQARLLSLCADLDTLGGGTLLVPLPPTQSSACNPLPAPLERALRALADLAAPFEARLALTPLLSEGDRGSSPAAVAALVERVGRPNLGLGLDLTEGDLPTEIPAPFSRRLWAVRLGAAAWGEEQASQLRALCTQLALAEFRGPYSVAPVPGASSLVEGTKEAMRHATEIIRASRSPQGLTC